MNEAIASSFSRAGIVLAVDLADHARASRSSARGRACRAPRPWSRSSGRRARRRRPPRRRCPTTRQALKPWRANTRTAASRIMRRLSAAAVARVRPSGVDLRAGGWPARAAAARMRSWRSRSRSAITWVSRVGRLREHDAPRVDDHRAPAGPDAAAGARRSGWRRRRTPGSRSRARAAAISQWSRVVASVNARGHGEDARAAHARGAR